MHVELLIVGQGISGSFLSYALNKAGRSLIVIDNEAQQVASRVASGIINPVTGRRIVKTWMIDELLPYAMEAYGNFEKESGVKVLRKITTVDFFPTPQMFIAFKKRFEEGADYLDIPSPESQWNSMINHDFGYGAIDPCLLIDMGLFLSTTKNNLLRRGQLVAETFTLTDLQLTHSGVRYKDITADKIIFCDGIGSLDNPFFTLLPFAPNKGELLIAEINDLPREVIIKYGFTIVPWKENLFWIGASHEWKFGNDQPTPIYREHMTAQLKRMLKIPFNIVDHLAAVRPATLERRPFIGLHPLHQQVGIFNGMGTKGCSLAPYFAQQFVEMLIDGKPLLPEVDINRFRNLLSKSSIS